MTANTMEPTPAPSGLSQPARFNRIVGACLPTLLITLLFHLFIGNGFAASPAEIAVRHADTLKQQQAERKKAQSAAEASADEPPETYPGENRDLGPQLLLKEKPKAKPFVEFSNDTMLLYTTNALSTAISPTTAGIVAETLSLALAPEAFDVGVGKLGLRAGYRHLFWIYDLPKTSGHENLDGFNFEMSSFFMGANLTFLENWNATFGLDFNRVLVDQEVKAGSSSWSLGRTADYRKWTESYVEWNPNWGLSRNISLADKLSLSISYSGGYRFSKIDPQPLLGLNSNTLDKLDNALTLSLMWSPSDKLLVLNSLRFSHALYTHKQTDSVHRRDTTASPSLTFIWTLSPRWSARVSLTGEFRKSNSLPDTNCYNKLDAATGLSLTLKF